MGVEPRVEHLRAVQTGPIGATEYMRPVTTGIAEYVQPGATTLVAPRAASLGTELMAPRVATTAPVVTTAPVMTSGVVAAPLMTTGVRAAPQLVSTAASGLYW